MKKILKHPNLLAWGSFLFLIIFNAGYGYLYPYQSDADGGIILTNSPVKEMSTVANKNLAQKSLTVGWERYHTPQSKQITKINTTLIIFIFFIFAFIGALQLNLIKSNKHFVLEFLNVIISIIIAILHTGIAFTLYIIIMIMTNSFGSAPPMFS